MGWTFAQSWTSKKVLVDYLTKTVIGGPEDTNSREETIAKKVIGKTLYFVREFTRRADGVRERVIFVVLLESDVRRGNGWGYKDMTESLGPNEDQCPLEFFKLVPEPPNAFAKEFRQRCILRAEREKMVSERLKVGATIRFVKGTTPETATIISMDDKALIIEANNAQGRMFKVSKRNYHLIREVS